MRILPSMTYQFSKVADYQPSPQEKPLYRMQEKTLDQILEPVRRVIADNPVYSSHDVDISYQLKELRKICHEMQARHKTDDIVLKSGRNRLLNSLQGLSESSETAQAGFVLVDCDDLLSLSNFTDIIRGNAKMYKEHMGFPLIANALNGVADNIDAAQSRGWEPENNHYNFLRTCSKSC